MAAFTNVEIIDLTSSPAFEPIVIEDSDCELPLPEPDILSSSKSKSQSRKVKSRRSRKNTGNDSALPVGRVDSGARAANLARPAKNGRRDEAGEERGGNFAEGPSLEETGRGSHGRDEQDGYEEGEVEEERSSRSSKSKRNRKSRDKEERLSIPNDQLFFVDTKPVPASRTDIQQDAGLSVAASTLTAPSEPHTDASKLFLPPHVTLWDLDFGVDAAAPVNIIHASDHDSDSDSYIDYLDYNDDRPVQRYFDEQKTKESKSTSFVCKKCGVRDDHRTWECRTQICLTCGARDEHSTYGCPVSKVCFTCNMKGHLSKDCPNRAIAYSMAVGKYHDCDRCGSQNHTTQECPTLWRQYIYVTDKERNDILREREEMRTLGIGNGGEGYIAGDDWCYNCGGVNHLGDDCQAIQHPPDFPLEPSAFSSFNTLSGPFSDTPAKVQRHGRERRDWENDATHSDRWGLDAPDKVGRRAKNKNKALLERHQREMEIEEDDPDNWFGNSRNARNRGVPSSAPTGPRDRSKSGGVRDGGGGRGGKKMTFGSFSTDFGQRQADRPSLADRIQDASELKIRGASSQANKREYDDRRDDERNFYRDDRWGRDRGKDRDSKRDWEREYERDRDRDKDRHHRRDSGYGGSRQDDRGPRYKGGYAR